MQNKTFIAILVVTLLIGGVGGYFIGHKVGTVRQQISTVNAAIKVSDRVSDSLFKHFKH